MRFLHHADAAMFVQKHIHKASRFLEKGDFVESLLCYLKAAAWEKDTKTRDAVELRKFWLKIEENLDEVGAKIREKKHDTEKRIQEFQKTGAEVERREYWHKLDKIKQVLKLLAREGYMPTEELRQMQMD